MSRIKVKKKKKEWGSLVSSVRFPHEWFGKDVGGNGNDTCKILTS